MPTVKAITWPLAALVLLMAQPLSAQAEDDPAAVFALIDKNEWCPGGSVYLDLHTGAFLLFPRLSRRACTGPTAQTRVEQGALAEPELQVLRSAYLRARNAGLRRDDCEVVISNGGPQVLAITAAGYSATTPEEEGCWSEEAIALHRALFDLFGEQRERR